ncbi:MAG TPA: hypothetical protein VFA18_10065 [Gemmataceae bacterium]|nr:hypothetical protein [Gemmataceae bacterium]
MSTLTIAPSAKRLATPSARPALGFFQRRLPVLVILGSFVFLTLPLAILGLAQPKLLDQWHIGQLYVVVLGTTHFLLTLTIYLQGSNLRYFSSTWKNRALYFLIPLAIFAFFDLYRTLQLAILFPIIDVVFRLGIRLFDFQHFGRQNYGILQLFKGRVRLPFPTWMRRAESAYFFSLTALLMLTFLYDGRFSPARLPTWILLGVAGCTLLFVVGGFCHAWRRTEQRLALLAPAAYFLLQSGSAAFAIYSSSLYVLCLAMHYVEYHVVMIPRCFHIRLDEGSRVDRVFRGLRQNRIIFYGGLVLVAAIASSLTWMAMGYMIATVQQAPAQSYLALISIFDGLFVFHYFIESLIWRFSDPYYRQTLGPLYFAPARNAG